MKWLIISLMFTLSASAESIFDYKIKNDSREFSFSQYRGKALLVSNIATKCGYTPQLDDLEALSKKYKDKLVVIGIPSNDFMGQTPEGDEEIAKFCKRKYGVTFPLAPKSIVKGDKKIPVIKFLLAGTGGDEISWNFSKFLVSKEGKVVQRFAPGVAPDSPELIKAIDTLIK